MHQRVTPFLSLSTTMADTVVEKSENKTGKKRKSTPNKWSKTAIKRAKASGMLFIE